MQNRITRSPLWLVLGYYMVASTAIAQTDCTDRLLGDTSYQCEFAADDGASGTFGFTTPELFGERFETNDFGGTGFLDDQFDDDQTCTCLPRGLSLSTTKYFEAVQFICHLRTVQGDVNATLIGKGKVDGTRIIGSGIDGGTTGGFGRTFVFKCSGGQQ